jgi:hypothetical protein
VLRVLVVAFSLEGILPGLGRARRPIGVVRYSRARDPRGRADLRTLARAMLATEPPKASCERHGIDWRRTGSRTSAMTTGARTVFFQER